jgi:hypothetical protein
MTFNSTLLLLMRSCSAALLMLIRKSYFMYLLGFDVGLYLLMKIIRGDMTHWVPLDGLFGFFFSFILRIMVKFISDYTGVIQFRANGELGGLYWTINIANAVLFTFAAMEAYYSVTPADSLALPKGTARLSLVGLSVAWAATFSLIMTLMKREYRRTFFSTQSGNSWAQSFFLNGETDAARSKTLKLNKKKWKAIEPQVKAWVQEGWWKWKEDKPDWFTDAWIAKIPDNMIPNDEDRQPLRAMRRRNSASVREVLFASAAAAPIVPEG